MSNARSPRDVCSTTMGTRGLIGPRFFSLGAGVPAGRSEATSGYAPARRLWTNFSTLVRRPDLLARGRPSRVDGLGVLDEEVQRGTLGEIGAHVVEAAGLLEALAQLLRRGVLARRRRLKRVEDVAVRRLDPLGLDHRREHRVTPQALLGVG